MYRPPEIAKILASQVLLLDTRENPRTEAYARRLAAIGLPCERVALSYGDYSCRATAPGGEGLDMRARFAIERKSGFGELCVNFTNERKRFQREFERARADGCRMHLVVEGGSYEGLRRGAYGSRMSPQSLIASLLSWEARYGLHVHFCAPETSGWLIGQILRYELRNYLTGEGAAR